MVFTPLENCRTSARPDDADQNFGWVIKRSPPDGVLKLVILSRDIFGIRTHFHRGRTGPCLTDGCEGCKAGHLSRWKGYLLAIDHTNGQRLVFEFTPPCATTLDEAYKKFGTMRGLQVVASRAGKRANAKVQVHVKGITVLGPEAEPDHDVWPILGHIWGLTSHTPPAKFGYGLEDLSQYEAAS